MFLLKKFFQKHKKMIFDFDRSCPCLMLNDLSKFVALYPHLSRRYAKTTDQLLVEHQNIRR